MARSKKSEVSNFSYDYYKKMLQTCLDKKYVISSFEKYSAKNAKTVILRHDVDYTMDGLLDLATIERELGCAATYFFRIHAHEYNIFEPITYTIMGRLKAMGHEIGLHFEAMNVGRALKIDPQDLLQREIQIMNTVLGSPIRSISEHREVSGTVHSTPLYEECFSAEKTMKAMGVKFFAMSREFSKNMKYLSDSNACWREGDILKHLGKHNRFQILVHPDWWFEKDLLLKGYYFHSRSMHP